MTASYRTVRAAWGAQGGAWRRPQSRPYGFDMNAPCVLASHHPARPVSAARTAGGRRP
jgi:hypothetical protein